MIVTKPISFAEFVRINKLEVVNIYDPFLNEYGDFVALSYIEHDKDMVLEALAKWLESKGQ